MLSKLGFLQFCNFRYFLAFAAINSEKIASPIFGGLLIANDLLWRLKWPKAVLRHYLTSVTQHVIERRKIRRFSVVPLFVPIYVIRPSATTGWHHSREGFFQLICHLSSMNKIFVKVKANEFTKKELRENSVWLFSSRANVFFAAR